MGDTYAMEPVCDCGNCRRCKSRIYVQEFRDRQRGRRYHKLDRERPSSMIFTGTFPKVKLSLRPEDILGQHGSAGGA